MTSESLKRRIEAAEQLRTDNAPRLPNLICYAEGDESVEQTYARLGIAADAYDTVIRLVLVDASTPRPEDSP